MKKSLRGSNFVQKFKFDTDFFVRPNTLKSAKIKSGSVGDARQLQPTLMTAVPEILERIRKAVHAQVKEGSFLKRTLFNYAYEYKRKNQIKLFHFIF